MQTLDHSEMLAKTNRYLFWLLLLMIACFFTWSENVIITRIIKVIGRMGGLGATYILYRNVLQYGAVDSLKWQNIFSPLMYVAYLVLGFISFTWSTNVGYSGLQWFMTAQTLVFCFYYIKILYLLDEYFPNHTIRLYNLIGNAVVVLILVFIIGMWIMPDVFFRMTHGGAEARLGGYMMNPNELGMLAGVGIAGLISNLYRNDSKWWTIIKLLILFYGLYATGSRSSLIGAMLIILFHIKQSSNVRLKVFMLTGMMLVTPLAIHQIVLKGGDSERIEEVMSMTGRLPFWKALINEGLPKEPLLGFGFMRIAYKDYFQSTNTYPGKMTHNTFIQVLMNLGFIGLTIIIFQMIFTFIGISKSPPEKKLMLYCLLIPLMVNSFTEFGIFGESNFGILFYQLIIIYISFYPNPFLTQLQKIHIKHKRPDLVQPLGLT